MVADKGGRVATLDKQCQLAEARANGAEREAEELRQNIFVRKLSSDDWFNGPIILQYMSLYGQTFHPYSTVNSISVQLLHVIAQRQT